MDTETWDLEAVYDEQISPLMAQIIAICKEHGMPMVASFAYAAQGDGEFDLCTTYINSEMAHGRLVPKFANISRFLVLG